jgi:oxygen-independent coproporphyrinogen III oxidase
MQELLPQPIGLYVHVPFCVSKCAYCDFASYARATGSASAGWREADIPRYVDAVIREITRRGAETGHPVADTIFLGGGTPSLLDENQVTHILDALFKAFPIEQCAEITCECNPGTLTTALAEALRKAGVNRLSIGAQARQERLLRILGRIHNWEQVVESVEIARKVGFDNINLDLMFGLPGGGKGARNLLPERPSGCFAQKVPGTFSAPQTVADLRETLEAALALRPTHISCYGLIVEEGTPMCRDMAAGKLALPDEEIERDMYELARQTLAEHGFHQYEISNFAREGYECRHNIGCWTRVPYLGFGSAAHSFFDECRIMNPSNLDSYLSGEQPKKEQISKEEARFESMMLGLRMTRGVKDEDFTRMHGMSIREAFGDKLDKPIAAGLLEWHEGAFSSPGPATNLSAAKKRPNHGSLAASESIRLTRLGMDLQNSVLVDLM